MMLKGEKLAANSKELYRAKGKFWDLMATRAMI